MSIRLLLDSDECPAECKDEEKTDDDTKVKSGDLAVSAEAAEGKRVLSTGISDMDTLTFKTSEEVEISKITLERYGYNSDGTDQIKWIWLEDQDGNIIAESKTLSKDKVTLNIKRDYKKVDGKYTAVIVIETEGASKGTIGFKVTDVDSTAKTLNVDNYSPYTYEIIEYTGAPVTVEVKGTEKSYNYEEGKSFELARLKIKANTVDGAGKDILVKGFTLTNDLKDEEEKALDMKEFLDDVTVTVDSKEIKAKATANKDDELVITFSEDVEIAMNKSALFVISATFKDFDAYGDAVKYKLAKEWDLNAVEKKNGTRVTVNYNNAKEWIKHVFAGGKIKLSNTKLWNIDAAQASEGTVIAEWNITITEPLSKISFILPVNGDLNGFDYIDSLTMVVNGDEFDGNRIKAAAYDAETKYAKWDYVKNVGNVYVMTEEGKGKIDSAKKLWNAVYEFKNVDIEKSGKIQFKVDITDTGNEEGNFQFDSFAKSALAGAKYDNTNKYVESNDVSGSIAFSKVNIQKAKASLKADDLKAVDFVLNKTDTLTVFKGKYTAKKGGYIDLNKFYVTENGAQSVDEENAQPAKLKDNDVTFRLFLNGEEVADTDTLYSEETFSDFRVDADKSVDVEVKAEVEAYNGTAPKQAYKIWLYGTDSNGNEDTGEWKAITVDMSVKETAGISIDKATDDKNTITLRKSNAVLASFNITPSNGNDSAELDEIKLSVTKNDTPVLAAWLTLDIDGVESDVQWTDNGDGSITYSLGKDIDGKTLVTLSLNGGEAGEYVVNLTKVNTTVSREWSKKLVNAEVFITSAKASDSNNSSTVFEYKIGDKYDSSYSLKNLALFTTLADVEMEDYADTIAGYYAEDWSVSATLRGKAKVIKEWDIDTNKKTLEVTITADDKSAQLINAVAYQVCGVVDADKCETVVVAWYDKYDDYLDYNGSQLRVYAYKS